MTDRVRDEIESWWIDVPIAAMHPARRCGGAAEQMDTSRWRSDA
jgi:hypothetical protein